MATLTIAIGSRQNSDARSQGWIAVDISLLCGLVRIDGDCGGEIKFNTFNFGRKNIWTKKYQLFDYPHPFGAQSDLLAVCPECGAVTHVTNKMIAEARVMVVQKLSAEGYEETDESGVFKR